MRSADFTYTVTQLNQAVRDLLESEWPAVWVNGELSNLARPASGHLYFTIKDDASQVRAAMFRGQARWLAFTPGNGQEVRVKARVSLYPARGDYQLIVERMEPAGAGALQAAFDALKKKLSAEGLFDPARKRPVPSFPSRIGVITSPTGAALRDILTVLRRRFPAIPVSLYPVAVQGRDAPGQIRRAVELAGRDARCDVLLIARGGGSLEDLQAFNDEGVARAVRACPIPVVSGVGHEIDFTITDFVADLRAATPSAAAEAASPDSEHWLRHLQQVGNRLQGLVDRRIHDERRRLQWLRSRLRHPRQRLQDASQRLDNLYLRLLADTQRRLHGADIRLHAMAARLAAQHPASRLALGRERCGILWQRLEQAMHACLLERRNRLNLSARGLHLVSPLATLDRGYAIVTRDVDQQLVTTAGQVQTGDRIQARLHRGLLRCTVNARVDTD